MRRTNGQLCPATGRLRPQSPALERVARRRLATARRLFAASTFRVTDSAYPSARGSPRPASETGSAVSEARPANSGPGHH